MSLSLFRQTGIGLLLAATAAFTQAGEGLSVAHVDGAKTVDVAEAKALFDNEALFVDPRKDSDWEAGRIPGALHLELKSAFNEAALLEEAGKDESIVFYCNGIKCKRSGTAAAKAVEWGFKKVYYFRTGLPAWKNAGYPIE